MDSKETNVIGLNDTSIVEELDMKIIRALQRDARSSYRDIARKIGVAEKPGPFFAARCGYEMGRNCCDTASRAHSDGVCRESLDSIFWDFLGGLAVAEDALKIVAGGAGGGFAVEIGDDGVGELHFGVHGMEDAGADFFFQADDDALLEVREQFVVGPHQI